MEIKQIEVNGTTYDIALPGNDIPLNAIVYSTAGSGDSTEAKLNMGGSAIYTKIENPEFFIKKEANGPNDGYTYSVVLAIPYDSVEDE